MKSFESFPVMRLADVKSLVSKKFKTKTLTTKKERIRFANVKKNKNWIISISINPIFNKLKTGQNIILFWPNLSGLLSHAAHTQKPQNFQHSMESSLTVERGSTSGEWVVCCIEVFRDLMSILFLSKLTAQQILWCNSIGCRVDFKHINFWRVLRHVSHFIEQFHNWSLSIEISVCCQVENETDSKWKKISRITNEKREEWCEVKVGGGIGNERKMIRKFRM